eukprot:scaffold8910_cov102-Cylindrotheca_fusiformis.AAC.3
MSIWMFRARRLIEAYEMMEVLSSSSLLDVLDSTSIRPRIGWLPDSIDESLKPPSCRDHKDLNAQFLTQQ